MQSFEYLKYNDILFIHGIYTNINTNLSFMVKVDIDKVRYKVSVLGGNYIHLRNNLYLFNTGNNVVIATTLDKLKISEDSSKLFAHISLNSLDCNNLDTSTAVYLDDMFCNSKINYLNMSKINMTNIKSMKFIFGESKIERIKLPKSKASNLRTISGMFYEARLCDTNLHDLDTHNVEEMQYCFAYSHIPKLNSIIKGLKTNSVINMESMFEGVKLDKIDISHFNMDKVKTARNMFNFSNIQEIILPKQ